MANDRLRRELMEGMQALRKIGVVSGSTMRQFENGLLGPPPKFSAKEIRRLREKYQVSQGIFAALLNITTSTLQKWEQGQKQPSAAACKLLQIVHEHGLGILVSKETRRAA